METEAIQRWLSRFADNKGPMELYLRWPERHEQETGEDSPLGLILCAGKSDEQIELLQLRKKVVSASPRT